MACEGCSMRFTILKRKRKCEDCGFIFCSECVTSKSKLYQCYRCKIFTCVPLNCNDVSSLKLRDLQWFLDMKGVYVSSSDRREKPILVERIMNYSRLGAAQSSCPQSYQSIYPSLSTEPNEPLQGLFGNNSVSTGGTSEADDSSKKEVKSNIINKHQIINLDSVDTYEQIYDLSAMELKVLLTRNFISFRGCCEKSELQEKVCWLWKLKEAAKNRNTIPDENLCKICMEANIDSLLLDCGHMVTCTECGRLLHDCPICRQIIVRVVRAFKS